MSFQHSWTLLDMPIDSQPVPRSAMTSVGGAQQGLTSVCLA